MTNEPLYEAICRYAARLLGDYESGRDVAQEVFLRFEQQRDNIQQAQNWAYRTARNIAIDKMRKSRPAAGLPDDLPADAAKFDPAVIAEQKETNTMLQQKINELSAAHREVLRLKFQEGLKYVQIAEVIGKPVTTVAWLLHEAVEQLRQEMKK